MSEYEVEEEKKQIRQYYTDTWVRTEKGWQVVASPLTDVQGAESGPLKKTGTRRKVG